MCALALSLFLSRLVPLCDTTGKRMLRGTFSALLRVNHVSQ